MSTIPFDWLADFERYLRAEWHDSELHVGDIEPYGNGHSGFTYLLEIESALRRGRYVLRLSPPNARIAGPTDIGRQGRIMAALGEAGIPVPAVLAMDSTATIGGRSFVLTERVTGMSFEEAREQGSDRQLAEAAVELLHRISSLPIEATGIGDETAIGLVQEIERWHWLMERAPDPLRQRAESLRNRLADAFPEDGNPRLVHGDYHYGNMLFSDGQISALLDWEIAEIGSPLLDLGCLAVASLRRRYEHEPNPTGGLDVSLLDLVRMYGQPVERVGWFLGLSCYKYSAILGYNLMLHLSGRRPDPVYQQLTGTMEGLIEDGLTILRLGIDAL